MREYYLFSSGSVLRSNSASALKDAEKHELKNSCRVDERFFILPDVRLYTPKAPLVVAEEKIHARDAVYRHTSSWTKRLEDQLPLSWSIGCDSLLRPVVAIIFIFAFFILPTSLSLHAQFTDVSAELGLYLEGNYPFYGSGVSFCDYNEDGWDDITMASNGNGVYLYQNTGDGFVLQPFFMAIEGDCKHPVWVDFDNDGDKDFFISRVGFPLVLYRNEGGDTFTDVSYMFEVDATYAASVNVAWADYDGDSFPDVYVCNHQNSLGPQSWLFHNNAGQSFTEVGAQLDVGNGVSKTFQALWSDFDTDGDQDLMVVNDMWQGCKLYRQNSDGSFTDVADSLGFNIEAHCMGLGVFDFDHDGDMNYYITNSEEAGGNILLEFDGQAFYNIAADHNVLVNQWCWGLSFLDRDNTGYEDLYVVSATLGSEESTYFDFTPQTNFLEIDPFIGLNNKRTYTVAKGDFDRDGRCDLVSTHISPVDMTLWHNEHIAGNWIRLTLRGVQCNRDAIGAIVKMYHGDIYTSRVLTCGDNYMSQDSQHLHFGLAEHELVDSLHIYWPNGNLDKYYALAANNEYEFYEMIEEEQENAVPFSLVVCPGQNLQEALISGNLITVSDTLLTTLPEMPLNGMYELNVLHASGEEEVLFLDVSFAEVPELELSISHPSCFGYSDGAIQLTALDSIMHLQWVGSTSGHIATGLPADIYTIAYSDMNNCPHVLTCELLNPPPIELSQVSDTVCAGSFSSFQPQAIGGSGAYTYYWSEEGNVPTLPGNYDLTVTDASMCSAEFTVHIIEKPSPVIALGVLTYCEGSSLVLEYSELGVPDDLSWDFPGYDPMQMSEGNYIIIASTDEACADTVSFDVHEIELPDYDLNLVTGPENCTAIDLVIDDADIISYLWSNGNTEQDIACAEDGYYSCILTTAEGCVMEIDCIVNEIADVDLQDQDVFPNPARDRLNISSTCDDSVELLNEEGRLLGVFRIAAGMNNLNLDQLSNGVYFLRRRSGQVERFVKTDSSTE